MLDKTVAQQLASDTTLHFFLKSIAQVRPQIQRLILFGSRARGDALPDSDYDLLLVVPKKTDALLDTLYDAVIETLLVSSLLISLKIFTESEYNRLNQLSTPFMRRVQTEGLPIG